MIAYMSTPTYKRALQKLQSLRLSRDHADLAAEPQYTAISKFFFTEMYGPRDFHNRDVQAHRLSQFVHATPGIAMRDVEQVLQLLELTNQLDDSVVAQLIALDAPFDFDEPTYEHVYRLANNYPERMAQIDMGCDALYKIYRLRNNPLLGIALQNTGLLAQAMGMADIHQFLCRGYHAHLPVRDMPRFVETVRIREQQRLNRIFQMH